MLSKQEITRYSRNILLEEVGKKGQEKIKSSTVTVIGAGGLGSPSLLYLAAAGVGNIRLVDSDNLDLTNLQRQILFNTDSVGKPKAQEGAKFLRELNPHICISEYPVRLTSQNAMSIIQNSDVVLEGSDNFETKFLVNDACYFAKVPLVVSGILRFEGQIIGIRPTIDPCYRCIFHSPPPPGEVPNCADAGVIGAIAGVMGSMQAAEAIKKILGIESGSFGSILQYNALTLEFRKLKLSKNSSCPLCGTSPSITELIDYNTSQHCGY